MCSDKPETNEQRVAMYLHCQIDFIMLEIFNLMLKHDENSDEFHAQINKIRNESVHRISEKLKTMYEVE